MELMPISMMWATRRAIAALRAVLHASDWEVLSVLYGAKKPVSFNYLNRMLNRANAPAHHNSWFYGSTNRLTTKGFATEHKTKTGKRWLITLRGKIAIHQLNEECIRQMEFVHNNSHDSIVNALSYPYIHSMNNQLVKDKEKIAAIRGAQLDLFELSQGQQFRVIPGYPEYTINCDGSLVKHVISDNDERDLRKLFLKPGFQPSPGRAYPEGYWYVTLLSLSSPRRIAVHRLVALAFVENPEPEVNVWVNHEDGNKLNNHYSNLKWGTVQYNILHAHKSGLCPYQAKRGADNRRTGTKWDASMKKRLSDLKMGENHPKFKGYYLTPAGKFPSRSAAAAANNTYERKVAQLCAMRSIGWGFESVSR